MIPTLLVVVLVAQGLILGLFLYYVSKSKADPDADRGWHGPLAEIETRMEQLEVKWLGTREQLIETMETGREAWRKVRQREALRERKEREADELEEVDMPDPEQMEMLPEPSADPRGAGFTREGEAPWQAAAKQLAEQYLRGGN